MRQSIFNIECERHMNRKRVCIIHIFIYGTERKFPLAPAINDILSRQKSAIKFSIFIALKQHTTYVTCWMCLNFILIDTVHRHLDVGRYELINRQLTQEKNGITERHLLNSYTHTDTHLTYCVFGAHIDFLNYLLDLITFLGLFCINRYIDIEVLQFFGKKIQFTPNFHFNLHFNLFICIHFRKNNDSIVACMKI